MAEPLPYYGSEPVETKPKKMAAWLIVLLIVLGACALLVLAACCVIAVLALLGPAIGNVFSNIVINI